MLRIRVLPYLFFAFLLFVGHNVFVSQAQAQSIPPRIFYTDLVSGPASGGPSSQGAFVTIYGNNFGSTRGTSVVQLNGKNVYSYPVWTNTKITVQIASGSTTGKLVVNLNGSVSNGLTFTVRSGHIFFVSTSGRDGNSGSYSRPWSTLIKARSTAVGGDIVYVMNGVQQTGADLSSASWTLSKSGTNAAPIAFVAYPNATVTIGSATGQTFGIRTAPNTSTKWIVIAGMKILGATTAVDFTSGYNWRLVGNDISCPNASGTSACVNAIAAGGSKLYGNNVHDTGNASASSLAQYDAVSLTNTNSLDIGWNEIAKARGCEALVVGGINGTANYTLNVHDNFIHDVRCNGVRMEKIDATKGAVKVANNLFVRTGTGPAPGGVEADSYAGISVRTNSSGQVQATNNTFYDCGARKNSDSGCAVTDSQVAFIDNIFQVTSGESYIASSSSQSNATGNNNLFYGAGAAPSVFSSSVSGNSNFANPAGNDFRLASGSAAIDKGVKTSYTTDLAGTWRPKGTAFDIGAYEYTGTSGQTGVSLTANPTSLSFGSVSVGSSSTVSGTLTNSSTSTSISVSAANVTGSAFSVSGLSFPATIAPGASVNYSAKFTPTATGSVSGTVSFVSDADNSPTAVTLSGSGTAAAVGTLAANPTSVAFGSITTGTTSTKTVTLTNSGSANLSLSAASVTGTGFSISGITTPLTLTPGQTATLSVKFAPTTAASFTGSVTLTSNASNSSLTIPLTGTGATTTTSHAVDLTWTASTTSGVAGYNVYRSTTSGSGYAKINTSLASGTAYTDSTVTSAKTYYYVLRSVTSTGLESADSSQVTAIIP